jgi:hypothetical protein
MAAGAKAVTDEQVIDAGINSMTCKKQLKGLEAVVGQLKREFKVKLLEARIRR